MPTFKRGCAVLLVISASACGRDTAVERAQQPDALTSLKLSQSCAESAAKFWERQYESKGFSNGQVYTSHYNTELHRCLVKVSSGGIPAADVISPASELINDAVEGTNLGFQTIDGPKITTFRMDQQKLGEDAPRQGGGQSEFAKWFRALMTQ
jgi:hypothetical protein